MFERKPLIRAMYELCVKFKELEEAYRLGEDVEGEIDGVDDAITELCRTVGTKRELLEQDCY